MPFLIPILMLVGLVCLFIGAIMFLLAAFRTHVGWGLAILFLPFASLAFLMTHWSEAKRPFTTQLGGLLILVLGSFASMRNGVDLVPYVSASESVPAPIRQAIQEGNGAFSGSQMLKKLQDISGDQSDDAEEAVMIDGMDPISFKGKDLDHVRRTIGFPKGKLVDGDNVMFLYKGFTLISNNGESVTSVQFSHDYINVPVVKHL